MLWYPGGSFFSAWGLLMGLETVCVLAIACSVVAMVCSLVVMIRSTPQRVRKAAYAAVEIAEETQNGFRAAVNRMLTFETEITREREASAADLEEAERKRRQAAAKLSALAKKQPATAEEQPVTLGEALANFPPGDPRRLQLLRRSKTLSEEHA